MNTCWHQLLALTGVCVFCCVVATSLFSEEDEPKLTTGKSSDAGSQELPIPKNKPEFPPALMLMTSVQLNDMPRMKRMLQADPNLAKSGLHDQGGGVFAASAIDTAAEWNRLEAMRILLDLGAAPDVLNSDSERTPLQQAAYWNSMSVMIELLDRGVDINSVGTGHEEGPNFRKIIQSSRYPYGSALDCAAEGGSVEAVRELLRRGAKLEVAPEAYRSSAIHRAMTKRWEQRKRIVQVRREMHTRDPMRFRDPGPDPVEGNVEVIELLMGAGADLHQQNFEGDMPLHIAVRNLQVATVAHLLDKYGDRIDVNARGRGGYTPLMCAVDTNFPTNSPEGVSRRCQLIVALKKHGAKLDLLTDGKPGQTAYEIAVECGHIAEVTNLLQSP